MSDEHDPLDVLGAEIEKAKGRGLLPKGGSRRMRGALRAHYGAKRGGSPSAERGKKERRLMQLDRQLRQRMALRKSDDISKAKAKTLYVYRPVENAADIIAWAESQGFKTTQPADSLHVTLAYSKTPLDWAYLHNDYHSEPEDMRAMDCACGPVLRSEGGSKGKRISGGIREVKELGKDGAIVLAFESDSLTRRFMDFKGAGAVWKFPSFTPHVTISYNGAGVDLSKVHAYAGDIVLGEECWEEITDGAQEAAIAAEKKTVTKADLEVIAQRLDAVEKKAEAA